MKWNQFCVHLLTHLRNFQSFNIATAVYNQQWYNADIGYKKMLVLIAARAQKPVELQATKFVLISRGTMTDVSVIKKYQKYFD